MRASGSANLRGTIPYVVAEDEAGLGSALRSLRHARGLSLTEAAARGGASPAALAAWESGRRRPRGPALARLLDGLAADARTKARLLHLADSQQVRIALADSLLGASVNVGSVLRLMRERRGLSQSDLARLIGVTQAAVSRWEVDGVAPSSETLHAAGFALGASIEETLALASAAGNGAGGLGDAPETVIHQIQTESRSPRFKEIVLLGWEAELGRRAARDARWDAPLAFVLSARAAWLVEEERYEEIAPIATRAIRLAATVEGRYWTVPAVAALADADRHSGRGHAAAAELAEEWAARLPDSLFRGWMVRQRGTSLVRMGRVAEGAELVARSADMDAATGELGADPWGYGATTLGEAYLEAGDPRRAQTLLRGERNRGFDWWTFVRIEHANGRAATEPEMALLRLRAADGIPSPLRRRRLAKIELRQSWLTGEIPPLQDPTSEGPKSDGPDAEDRLWAEILRPSRD